MSGWVRCARALALLLTICNHGGVAAGILPAGEPGILPGGLVVHTGIFERRIRRQDAALHGRHDARRYVWRSPDARA
jgi:hypothetical protein